MHLHFKVKTLSNIDPASTSSFNIFKYYIRFKEFSLLLLVNSYASEKEF